MDGGSLTGVQSQPSARRRILDAGREERIGSRASSSSSRDWLSKTDDFVPLEQKLPLEPGRIMH